VKRISAKYRVHVDAIAEIFVDEADNRSRTVTRVRSELGLTSVTSNMLRRWLDTEEFRAAVALAREIHADEKRVKPSVRGPEKIAWLLTVEKRLKDVHEEAEGKERKDILNAILKVGAEIRAEESHFEDMKTAKKRREFGLFLRRLVQYVARSHESVYPVVAPVLKDALRNIGRIMQNEV